MALDPPAAQAYLDTPMPDAGTPWREAAFTVVDLELTGLDPASDEIISFATVTVADGRVRLGDARYALVRPNRMPDRDTIRIHGLREMDLEDAPPLAKRLDDLLEALTGRAIVAHVATIEREFLGAALAGRGLELINPTIDTAALAVELGRLRREPPPGAPEGVPSNVAVSSPGLSNVARSLGLPVHRPHHADGDALTTAQAFIALATHLDAFQPQTVGSLERASSGSESRPWLGSLLRRLRLRRRRAQA